MPLSGGVCEGSREAPPITVADVVEHIRISCGIPSAGPTVGAEVEWLVIARAQPSYRPSVSQVEELLADLPLPGGSRVSFEPGGQLELSSVPALSPDAAYLGLSSDFGVVRGALRSGGLDLLAAPHDSSRPPARVSQSARYEAMERWFAAGGWTEAAEMMCNTASIQVNVGCGADPSATWRRANELAPVLAATFACSPGDGWASRRLRTWAHIDPSRTSSALDAGDAIADWARYALAARVIMRSGADGGLEPVMDGVTFEEWIEDPPAGVGSPTMADLQLHLSTLFPPVRLKGWIEIRVIDMQDGDFWPVPLAVTAALLAPTGDATDDDMGWLRSLGSIDWKDAGRAGLRSAELAAAADASLRVAAARLEQQGSRLTALVEQYRLERVAPWLRSAESPDAI